MENPKFESKPHIPWFDKEIFDEYVQKGDEARAAYEDFEAAQKKAREASNAQPWEMNPLHQELQGISIRILQLEDEGIVQGPEVDKLKKEYEEKLPQFRESIKELTLASDERVAKWEIYKEKHKAFMEVADRMLQRESQSS